MTWLDPTLLLSPAGLAQVIAWQCEAGVRREICGLSTVDAHGIQHIVCLTNHARLPDLFEIALVELQIAEAAIEQRHWTIQALIHTHPQDSPAMSQRDARCFNRDTWPWIIIGTPTTLPHQQGYRHSPAVEPGSTRRVGYVRDEPGRPRRLTAHWCA